MSKFRSALKVKQPCKEAWAEMAGNDQVRFCSHCSKNVNNLSEMTRQEAKRLVKNSGGGLCVRYVQHPVTRQPLFANDLYQISRRAPRLAAGVIGAALSCASLSYAQGSPDPATPAIVRNIDRQNDGTNGQEPSGTARITGFVTSPEGDALGGINVFVKEKDSGTEISTATRLDGSFTFEWLSAGTYSLRIEGGSLVNAQNYTNIQLANGTEFFRNLIAERRVILLGVVSLTYSKNNSNSRTRSDLAEAVYSEEIDDVLELLARGADPNETDEDGDTPLFISVDDGTLHIAKALLDFGASAKTVNKAGRNVLFLIDEETSVDLVKMLIAYGADVNHRLEDGATPLIHAAKHGTPELVQALIDAGADVNAADEEGWTPLMKAAWEECVERVRMLLKAGADVNARNKKGETAWDQAAEREVEELLERYGAIIDDDYDDDDEP